MTERPDLDTRQRLFLYLVGVFLTALLIGDTIGSKLFVIDIPLGFTILPATLSVGAIWFPITFLLTDTVNEFYGVRGARTMTFVGFWMALLAFFVIYVSRKIPAASFSPISQQSFDSVFGGANRIFVASLCAYIVGQLVDIAVFQRMKSLTQSKHIWLRSTGSTLISQLIDTLLVTYIAFGPWLQPPGSHLGQDQLSRMAVTSYTVKVMLAIGLTPVIYALHGLIHRRMGIEPTPHAGHVDLGLTP